MNFENTTYKAERKLLDEIANEKKFLTFKKLFNISATLGTVTVFDTVKIAR